MHPEPRSPVVAAPGAPAPGPLSEELSSFLERFADRPVSLGEVLEATRDRGYYLLLLALALPFVGPIPLPGFSLPFGLLVSLLGLRLTLDRKSWLPRCVLRREVSIATARRLLVATRRILRMLEFLLRPRWGFAANEVAFVRLGGLLIVAAGLMLMLPFPLPFSNSLPAWSVILLSAGALGRDGLFFFAGCAVFLVSLAFFALVIGGGLQGLELVRSLFAGRGS